MTRPDGVVRSTSKKSRKPGFLISLTLSMAAAILVSSPGRAIEFGNGFVELHGAYQMEFRGIADSFELTNFNPHQWAHTLSLEAEFDLLPDGWGPISLLQGFIRVEGRYDCVWQSMCHIATGQRLWGNEANRAPSQFTNGRSSGFTGRFRNPSSPSRRVHGSGARLVGVAEIPPLDTILGIGGAATELALARTLGPVSDFKFAVKHIQGSVGPLTAPLGPWTPEDVKANGALRNVPTAVTTLAGPATIPIPLPLRPAQGSLFSPSPRLREIIDDLDDLDVNFSENELQWNRGASQQQVKELREAYLDIEFLDGQLFLRVGRQTTVWGKTELFRAQDQFNPQDIALATLSSLESSRIALWSLRAIWSFWNVGPFEDVRLELATNLDHFEPTDLGICGEPYTVWLVCLKKFGAYGHGLTGVGLAGEERPQDPWNSTRGLEAGLRLEFRYGRFSFAITNFYGFPDVPVIDIFNEYDRNADPVTGRPRIAGATGLGTCITGFEETCLSPANAGTHTSGNRQFFDVLCSASSGLAANAGVTLAGGGAPVLQSDCALDLFNTVDSLTVPVNIAIRSVLGLALGGDVAWTGIGGLLAAQLGATFVPAVALHQNPLSDGADLGFADTCGSLLTDQQEALFGTGRFFHPNAPAGTDICGAGYDLDGDGVLEFGGVDLYSAEASVILSAFPQFDGPIGTRFIAGVGQVQLPGARSPFSFFTDPVGFRYNPLIDGCVTDLSVNLPAVAAALNQQSPGLGAQCNGAANQIDPRTGQFFQSEVQTTSYNLMILLSTLSGLLPDNENCSAVSEQGLLSCTLITALFSVAGARRPDISAGGNGRFGRRDFLWHGGGEARLLYKRRNVLGFSMDFAEDRTKTNWGIEFVWFEDEPYSNTHEKDGWSRNDTLNLTVSVDRPTFINFLNANRTIFFNAQFFVRWIDGYTDKALTPDGPFSALMTLTAFTGFWQDRLISSFTLIHEIESNSSGLIVNYTYRMTENFSVSTGLTTFRGEPRSARQARVPLALSSTAGNDYETRTRFNGLTPVSDREELFVTFRYTF